MVFSLYLYPEKLLKEYFNENHIKQYLFGLLLLH